MQKVYYRVQSGQCHKDKSRAHIFTQNRGCLSEAWGLRNEEDPGVRGLSQLLSPLVFKPLKAPAPATWVRTEVQVGRRAVVETRKAQGERNQCAEGQPGFKCRNWNKMNSTEFSFALVYRSYGTSREGWQRKKGMQDSLT